VPLLYVCFLFSRIRVVARFMIEARLRLYMNSCGSCAGARLQRMLFRQLARSFSWQSGRPGNWQRRRPGSSRWVVCHILQSYNSTGIRSRSPGHGPSALSQHARTKIRNNDHYQVNNINKDSNNRNNINIKTSI
jgi:hypothetical protein